MKLYYNNSSWPGSDLFLVQLCHSLSYLECHIPINDANKNGCIPIGKQPLGILVKWLMWASLFFVVVTVVLQNKKGQHDKASIDKRDAMEIFIAYIS